MHCTAFRERNSAHAGAASLAQEFFPAEAIPHPDASFDFLLSEHVLEHLTADHEAGVKSDESAHWEEWLEKVIAPNLAPHYRGYTKEESLSQNLIHRHVFTPASTTQILEHLGLGVIETQDRVPDRGDSFALVAMRPN